MLNAPVSRAVKDKKKKKSTSSFPFSLSRCKQLQPFKGLQGTLGIVMWIPKTNVVLDEGKLKSVPEVNMNSYNCYTLVLRKSSEYVWSGDPYHPLEEVRNNEYKPMPESLQAFVDKCKKYDLENQCADIVKRCLFHEKHMIEQFGDKFIYDYLGVKPFRRSIMINISPDWKIMNNIPGIDYSGRDKLYRDFLYRVIEMYLTSCHRWSRWKYVIECGSDGTFIHAHIVAEINKDHYKSVMTHIKKGNINQELRKSWNRAIKIDCKEKEQKGIFGPCPIEEHCWVNGLKGKWAVKTTLINNSDILKDKLNYLHEELKPDSHKNASHPMYPLIVDNWD